MDFLVITALAMAFLALSWLNGRAVSARGPLNAFKRTLLFYSFVFVLGIGYIMLLVADLPLSISLLFPMIGCWAAAVGFVAWWRHRKASRV